jgi:hypothetical protein
MSGDLVDDCEPSAIGAAVAKVSRTPGLRIRPGEEAKWDLYDAPDRTLPRNELKAKYRALNAHFGMFCRRVVEELGDLQPRPFALADSSTDDAGRALLTLKPTVVAAIRARRMVC